MKKYMIALLCIWVGGFMPLTAQEANKKEEEKRKDSKAWELGVGGTIFQFSRAQFSNFEHMKDKGYTFDLKLKHAVYGGNIYVARELNSHFYLDLQGSIGATKDWVAGKEKTKMLYMVGPGLQWRLGEYFGSKYIDPYIRAGVNYMNKGFNINYMGLEGLSDEEMSWILANDKNKEGRDKKHLIPVAVGGGINMWLNDHIGIGLQADYLIMPYKQVANSLQGTARIIWRIGGKSKKSQPKIEYIEREKVIERIVEKPVEVEKIVERVEYTKLYDLFNNIYFDFDKATLTPQTEKVMDEIAEILKQHSANKYLITGYTDAKGSAEYNLDLSKRRAQTVVKGLLERGVSSEILKSVGVGKKISHIKPEADENVREGDRKVTIELIKNQGYWDNIPK